MVKSEANYEGRTGRVSTNLATAKGFAALVVMFGHYSSIPNFWVIVTVGLLIFSISSAYFTSQKYRGQYSWKGFWRRKVVRLMPHLLVIESFLLVLFLIQGRPGLWSWHTVVNVVGMNGFLNWLRIQNTSPFGAGMWFLTLLIVFYLVYPLLEKLYVRRSIAVVSTVALVLVLFGLSREVQYGHALWLTAAGFPVGMFLGRYEVRAGRLVSLSVVVLSAFALVAAHAFFRFDGVNFLLILGVSVAVVLVLSEFDLPRPLVVVGSSLSGSLFEIYLLHPHLKFDLVHVYPVDLLASMAAVLGISVGLSALAGFVDHLVFREGAA